MLAYAAMMTGQSELAVQHIRAMVEGIPLDFVKEHAAIAESFVGLPYEVLIRFGRWDDILAAPDHPDFIATHARNPLCGTRHCACGQR